MVCSVVICAENTDMKFLGMSSNEACVSRNHFFIVSGSFMPDNQDLKLYGCDVND